MGSELNKSEIQRRKIAVDAYRRANNIDDYSLAVEQRMAEDAMAAFHAERVTAVEIDLNSLPKGPERNARTREALGLSLYIPSGETAQPRERTMRSDFGASLRPIHRLDAAGKSKKHGFEESRKIQGDRDAIVKRQKLVAKLMEPELPNAGTEFVAVSRPYIDPVVVNEHGYKPPKGQQIPTYVSSANLDALPVIDARTSYGFIPTTLNLNADISMVDATTIPEDPYNSYERGKIKQYGMHVIPKAEM